MRPGALAPYERALSTREPLHLRHRDGRVVRMDVARWLADADGVDLEVVRRCTAPLLDIGCGPGRMIAAAAANGLFALGVDIADTAVALARARGLSVLRRDVFEQLPGEGRWRSLLLIDGNVGIGGDLVALLERVRDLLAPEGCAIIEAHPDPDVLEAHSVRFVLGGRALGPEFPWCYAGSRAVVRAAARVGLVPIDSTELGGRTFVTVQR